ncbi:MAG: hypothetical protein NW215_10310 [Hyphomicrobiales bacterium]|nr:hypothetical protein [Hyphomicrobiales bacterium]
MRFFIFIFAIVFLSSCGDPNLPGAPNLALNDQGAPTPVKAQPENAVVGSGFASLVSIDLPVDAKTGGYQKCLRDQDLPDWKGRLDGTYQPSPAHKYKVILQGPFDMVTHVTAFTVGQLAQIKMVLDSVQDGEAGAKPYAMCGNWCGPGHPHKTKNPDVIDPMDAACRIHDLCYRQMGGFNCQCDQMFVDMIMKDRTIFDLNSVEYAMVAYMKGSPCRGGCKYFDGEVKLRICGR